jgi:DNA-binding CsgD family transcriptional regulator
VKELVLAFKNPRLSQLNEDEAARLTPAQRAVAACVAEGLTNDQIAERLMLTSDTVAILMEDILKRLDLKSRASIAFWAVRHGIYSLAS